MAEETPVLEVRNLTKRFPGVLANDHINLKLYRGKVLGLLGENGAGKSTLMNMIYGLYTPDEGEILVNGQPIEIHDPRDAIKHGIGMVHQHFQLVETLTVTENVMLGNEKTSPFPSISREQVFKAAAGLLAITAALWVFLEVMVGGGVRDVIQGLLSGGLLGLVLAAGIAVLVLLAGVLLGGNLDRRAARRRILQLSEQYNLQVDPDALIQDLPVGIQQRVEIIKALYRDADILILDEPTAVLTPQEIRGLFEIMRTLLERGVSIIFISHKLKEVLEICDDVTVLRRGKVGGSADPKKSTEQLLASMMVGRDVLLEVNKDQAQAGEPILQVFDLHVVDDRNLPACENVSLEVRAGEILGIAGVQGNGQTELVEAITGLRKVQSGRVMLNGQEITNASPRSVVEAGVSHVPEDRQQDGLVGTFPIMDNMVLNTYYRQPFSRGILVNDPAIEAYAAELVKRYDVRTPSIYVNAGTLSGGNQQKVIVAREFTRPSKLLIASQPTRGLDVGSIEFIHRQIVRLRDEGVAVLLVSTELDEILGLSDRVAVMFDGQIIDVLPIEQADRETVGLRMAGIKESS